MAVVALLSVVVAGCSGGAPVKTLNVSAAASLSDVFAEIATAYEAEHPELDVVLNLGGSAGLREQILEGAPADVFASANTTVMDDLVAEGEVDGAPLVFARNTLEIAVPAGNPAGVTGLADFADRDLLIGLCAVGVPCGDSAREALARAGVTPSVDTNEPDVRSLLGKVASGELDAGITYVTDVLAAGDDVDGVDIPPDWNVTSEYPIAVLVDASEAARGLVDFVLSAQGREILTRHGFVVP